MSERHENRHRARDEHRHGSGGHRGHSDRNRERDDERRHDRGRDQGDGHRRDRGRDSGDGGDNARRGAQPARSALRDPKLASIFSVCGSYFVDVLFNHMYNAARPTGNSSITDEYRQNASAYMIGVKSDAQCYHTVVQNLHQYFVNHTRLTTMTFSDFVDKVVSCFVPASYYMQMTAEEKDEILSSVICELVSGLVVFCTSADMLRRVIDARETETAVTIRMMQEKAVAIQEQKRDAIHNDFLRQLGQPRETVPALMVEKMKKALKQLAREKADEEARADDAEEEIEGLQDEIDDLQAEVRHLRERVAKYQRLVELTRGLQSPEGRAELQRLQTQPRYDRIAETKDKRQRADDRGPPPPERIAENRGGRENGGHMEERGAKPPGVFNFRPAPLAALTSRPEQRGNPRPQVPNSSRAAAEEATSGAWEAKGTPASQTPFQDGDTGDTGGGLGIRWAD